MFQQAEAAQRACSGKLGSSTKSLFRQAGEQHKELVQASWGAAQRACLGKLRSSTKSLLRQAGEPDKELADISAVHAVVIVEIVTTLAKVVLPVHAFGGDMIDKQVESLFRQAGEQHEGILGVDALADLLQQHVQKNNLFKIIKR